MTTIPNTSSVYWSTIRRNRLVASIRLSFEFYSALIAVTYLVIRLSLGYGLDDTHNIRVVTSVQNTGLSLEHFLEFVFGHFVPGDDPDVVYRPLRTAFTFLEYYFFPFPSIAPVIINVAILYFLSLFGMKLILLNTDSKLISILGTLLFFTLVPVVAMGQIVLISQFLVLLFIVVALYFWQQYFHSVKIRHLIPALIASALGPYYSEASAMVPVIVLLYLAVSYRGQLIQRQYWLGLVILLLLVFHSFAPDWPFQLSETDASRLQRTGAVRGYDVSDWGIFIRQLVERSRPDIIVHILFILSPLLFITSFTDVVSTIWRWNRIVVLVAGAIVGISTALYGPVPALWSLFGLLLLLNARRYPMLASWCLAYTLISILVYFIEVHLTYLLWPLAVLVLVSVGKQIRLLWSKGKALQFVVVLVISVVSLSQVLNVVNTRTAMAATLGMNQTIAREISSSDTRGRVLVNFRNGMDLDFYSNEAYYTSEPGLSNPGRTYDWFFTVDIGSEPVFRDAGQFSKWISDGLDAESSSFLVTVTHDRVQQDSYPYHEHPFQNQLSCAVYELKELSLSKRLVFLDPTQLMLMLIEGQRLSPDFILHPGYPDTIHDIGIRTQYFHREFYADYEIHQLNCSEPIEVIHLCLKGYQVFKWRDNFYALRPSDGPFIADVANDGGYLSNVDIDELISAVEDMPSDSGKDREYSLGIPAPMSVPELALEGFAGYNVIHFGDRFFGIRQSDGSFDLERLCIGGYTDVVEGASVDEVTTSITKLSPEFQVVLEERYKGYNIIALEHRIYAILQSDGAFDLDKFESGDYEDAVDGSTLEEVKLRIDEQQPAPVTTPVPTPNPSLGLIEEGYKGYNIIALEHRIYAILQSDGAFDLAKFESGDYEDAVDGSTLEEVKEKIDDQQPIPVATAVPTPNPTLGLIEEGYKGYNIIALEYRIYAILQSDGAFDLDKFESGDYENAVDGSTLEEVKQAIDDQRPVPIATPVPTPNTTLGLIEEGYKGFNIIALEHRIYGILQSDGAFDLTKFESGDYENAVDGSTLEEVKEQIDEQQPVPVATPMPTPNTTLGLIEEGYKGYNIIALEHRIYGILQSDGAFDLDRFESGDYNSAVDGSTLEEVKLRIDELSPVVPETQSSTSTETSASLRLSRNGTLL